MINQNNSHNLFFASNQYWEFPKVLAEVQKYISEKYASLILEGNNEDVKQQIKYYIQKYLTDNRLTADGMSETELIDKLYMEMAEFSFLTKYIFGTGIEEIDINAWNDIEIYKAGGKKIKLDEHFDSPQHAINVVRRMLHVSGMVLDNASPAVLGHLSKNIRISALKTPLVDEDVGVCASIRIVNPQNFEKKDFVKAKTATEPMLDFLSQCIRYGVSVCVAGATGSGKTTVAGWMLSTFPHDKRIYTIESGSREVALAIKKDGKIINSVIHTLTRPSDNDAQNIDQDILLDFALRFNPDLIFVGEMRGAEAHTAQESSRTGHPVLTTIHSNSCEATYALYKNSAGEITTDELDEICAEIMQESKKLREENKKHTMEIQMKGAEQARLRQIFEAIDHMSEQMTEFDDETVRAVVERIDVISQDKIIIWLIGGISYEKELTKAA